MSEGGKRTEGAHAEGRTPKGAGGRNEDTTARIERIIDAPPEAVFRAWTTKEAMEQWYADGDDAVAHVIELDVRVGGRYRIEWGPKGEKPHVETGVYLELDPPRKLKVTETLQAPESTPWADTTVTVSFEEEDGKTRLTLVHENFPSREQRDNAVGGWPGFIDRVERVVAGTRG